MKKGNFISPAPRRILVITLRFLGDTLLVTPLLNALKQAYPKAKIEVLTYTHNALILEGNPAVSRCILTPQRPKKLDYIVLFQQIFRRYDLAISTQTGDRPTLYAWLAAKTRIGFIPKPHQKGHWKRYVFQRKLIFDEQKTHTVLEMLRLCQLLNIIPVYTVTPPSTSQPVFITTQPYVVLHVLPQWRYKRWTTTAWVKLGIFLQQQHLQIVLSGSPATEEMNYLRTLQHQLPADTLNLAGKVSLSQLANIIKEAQFFVGVDTGISHLAAATGVKTLVLLGPSDPVKWSPWPHNYHSKHPPFQTKGCQQVNNIYLIQGEQDCVPCYLEGCDQHQQSHSLCLDTISIEKVTHTIQEMLN